MYNLKDIKDVHFEITQVPKQNVHVSQDVLQAVLESFIKLDEVF